MNHFQQQAISFRNELRQSLGALVGIVQGILADGDLNDSEIHFLHNWLQQNATASAAWPGNVVHARLHAALQDGRISPEERVHLIETLKGLVGGELEELASSPHICTLALDDVDMVAIQGRTFCLTGNFAFGTRSQCEAKIEEQGGTIATVTRRLNYLVIGGLGSAEWKHGSFGTKVEKAMAAKEAGSRILVVHEDALAASLMSTIP